MRYTVLLTASLLFFFLKSSYIADRSFPLNWVNEKPVIELMLNGQAASFMLDTGSDLTLIDVRAAKKFGFELHDLPAGRNQIQGIGNQKQAIKLASQVRLEMGDKMLFTSFVGTELSVIGKRFNKHGKAPLVGIIGADLMQMYGFVIDYETAQVELKLGEKSAPFAEAN